MNINAAEHSQESTENGLFHDKLRHLETQGTRREREHCDGIIVDGQVVRDQDRLAADTARPDGLIFIIYLCMKAELLDRPACHFHKPIE